MDGDSHRRKQMVEAPSITLTTYCSSGLVDGENTSPRWRSMPRDYGHPCFCNTDRPKFEVFLKNDDYRFKRKPLSAWSGGDICHMGISLLRRTVLPAEFQRSACFGSSVLYADRKGRRVIQLPITFEGDARTRPLPRHPGRLSRRWPGEISESEGVCS